MLSLFQATNWISMQIKIKLNIRNNTKPFYDSAVIKDGMLVMGKHQNKICPLFGASKVHSFFKILQSLFIANVHMNLMISGVWGNQITAGLNAKGIINTGRYF